MEKSPSTQVFVTVDQSRSTITAKSAHGVVMYLTCNNEKRAQIGMVLKQNINDAMYTHRALRTFGTK